MGRTQNHAEGEKSPYDEQENGHDQRVFATGGLGVISKCKDVAYELGLSPEKRRRILWILVILSHGADGEQGRLHYSVTWDYVAGEQKEVKLE